MAASVTKTKATPNRLVYLVAGDGEATGATITSATLLADAVSGPLRNSLNASYANQAAMRDVIGEGNVEMSLNARAVSATGLLVDVDTDAVTPTKPEINLTFPSTADLAFYLTIEFKHSGNRQ